MGERSATLPFRFRRPPPLSPEKSVLPIGPLETDPHPSPVPPRPLLFVLCVSCVRVFLFSPCFFVVQVSSFFETFPYRLDESTGQIDYDTMAANAKLFRPKVGTDPKDKRQLRCKSCTAAAACSPRSPPLPFPAERNERK